MSFKIFTHSLPSSHSTHTKNRFLVTHPLVSCFQQPLRCRTRRFSHSSWYR